MDSASNNLSALDIGPVISGRWVVVAMFVFALTTTGTLYLYWYLHTGPFRPLQEVLAHEFEGSHPLVQGGQEKVRKGSPKILRITLRVDFAPDDENNDELVDKVVDRISQLADEYHGLAKYNTLEIHLIRLRAEKTTQQREIKIDLPASN
jgi:hypothetical protein